MLNTPKFALVACVGLGFLAAGSLRAQNSFDFPRPSRNDTEATARAATTANTTGLGRKVVRIKANGVPASAVFLAIAEKAGMQVGMELTRPNEHSKVVSLDISGGTVFEALDKVCQADQAYLLRSGGSGYENYFPREYQTRDTHEVMSTSPAYVLRPYIFTTKVGRVNFAGTSPEEALDDLLRREEVRTKPPGLPLDVLPSGKPSTTHVRFGDRDIRVRQAINLIAGISRQSWIAYIPPHAEGKAKVRVRLFEKAIDVCPEVAKVIVELE